MQRKSFASPDQVRNFPSGRVEVIRLDEISIGRFSLQPGWRWSKDVAPVARTRSCQLRHVGYALSGSLLVTMDGGTELVIQHGDGFEIPPGHEVLVLGPDPWESVEFASAHSFGVSPEESGESFLATVLFSDVVGSTEMLARVGDRAFTELLHEHNVRIRETIDRFSGREIATTGDGFLSLFDGAARAVRAAAEMDPAPSTTSRGLPARAGSSPFSGSPAREYGAARDDEVTWRARSLASGAGARGQAGP